MRCFRRPSSKELNHGAEFDAPDYDSSHDEHYEPEVKDSSEAMSEQNIKEDLPLDSHWDDLVSAAPVAGANNLQWR